MTLRTVLINKRLAELEQQIALPEIVAALNRQGSVPLRLQWIEAIRDRDHQRVGRLTLRLVSDYLRPSAEADVDGKITADAFTAAEVAEILDYRRER